MRRIAVLLSLSAALLVYPVAAQQVNIPWPTQAWQTASPESQGVNSEGLAAMLDTLAQQDVSIHSVLVIRNGYLVLEAYRYPYTASGLHTVYSVTKSFTSALVGIAIEQGYIQGVEQPMLDFFPDYTIANLDASKRDITLENLLTMSSGFDWPGGMNEPLLFDLINSEDWIQFVLDRPMRYEPGQFFVYNSAVSNLLAALVEEITGQPLLDFAQTRLFEPLGIRSLEWAADPQGRYLGGFGLQLTPRDMAKFGYLYLNNGLWDGQQLVSADWVAASTQQHIGARPLSNGYGYQWWVDVHEYYMAIGYGGQYIIVYPPENLVVVFTSAVPPSASLPQVSFLQDFILPAIQANEPLPDNPEGSAALEEAVEALAHPAPEVIPPLPETAARISGQEYTFPSNDFGWDSLTLTFTEATDTAQLFLDDDPPLNIGLDNVVRVNSVADAEAIFAIGFDNILRVEPVAGVEPMLVTGSWQADDQFVVRIELAGTVNWYQLALAFSDLNLRVTTRNGLSGSSYAFTGTAA